MEIALAAAVLGASVIDDLCDAVGSDLSRASRENAFEHANMNRVALRAPADDPHAVATSRKVGFVEEGRQRQLAWVQGTYEDVLVMAILRDERESHS